MIRRSVCSRILATLMVLPSVISGCTGSPRHTATERLSADSGKPVWGAIDAGRYRVQFTHLAPLSNTGLQLPRVSPDGRWLAALACSNALALDPDALLTGRTISDVSLMLYSIAEPQRSPRVVAVGAAWPVWSPDSKRLIAISHDDPDRCGLVIHDIATAQTRRMKIGLAHLATPAISPQGRQLALASFAETPEQARIYVYDLESGHLTPLPPPKDGIWQITPMWVSEQALLYFGRVGADAGLLGATTNGAAAHTWLAKVRLPANAAEVMRSQAGIAQPLSPDGHWLAMYDASANRIVLHSLDDSRTWPLDSSSQTGCWSQATDGQRFVYASDKQLLVSNPQGQSHVLASNPFLPVWCESQGGRFVLLAPGQKDWTFDLLRMQVTPSP